jgi:hypothetical protein
MPSGHLPTRKGWEDGLGAVREEGRQSPASSKWQEEHKMQLNNWRSGDGATNCPPNLDPDYQELPDLRISTLGCKITLGGEKRNLASFLDNTRSNHYACHL